MSTTPAVVVNRSPSEAPTEDALALDPTVDAFTLFGLAATPALDRAALEDAYLRLAAAVHPDRFGGADSGTRRRAMELSSAVNQGYRTLRDPVSRAEYLVKLGGTDLDSSDPKGGAPKMGQAFLMEMIERRESVEAAKAAGAAALAVYRDAVEEELDDALDKAMAALERRDFADGAHQLVARRYLQRLLDEIDGSGG